MRAFTDTARASLRGITVGVSARGAATRIVIADDHAMFRHGLRSLLERDPAFAIVGEAADTRAAVWACAEHRPQILVVDLSMPEGNVVEAIPRIVGADPAIRVVVLTMHDDQGFLRAALGAGAVGYVLKRSAADILVQALHTVRAARMFVDPTFPLAVAGPIAQPRTPLSPREREVLRLLARGLTYRAAGERLRVGERTIETHRRHIAEKLGLRSRAELLRYALESGLLTPGDEGVAP